MAKEGDEGPGEKKALVANENVDSYRCWMCQGVGHSTDDCPELPENKGRGTTNDDNSHKAIR